MKKALSIITIVLFFFSCSEKEKSYEELEAEVLCDVLPEIAKLEIKSFLRLGVVIPPPELDKLNYTNKQIDSIKKVEYNDWEKYKRIRKEKSDSIINLVEKFKRIEFGILDTLRDVEKLKFDKSIYKFNSLDFRGVDLKEFEKCNLKINLVNYKNTFEGEDRNSNNPLVFLTRVLIDENEEKAFFSVLKMYGTYHVFCNLSVKENKWKIEKIIKE
ncbi:MAG: hypothetical protein LDL23_02150 [Flavobacterium sp.]|uniref:hypothetical protein n=1 Tax=Flavobacterium sp. TaxID=239 RepID=UPI0025BA45D9|nr:hypothetical protein [Flavobacterium sp.]MCA1965432.1 hypothetical protein [Flavobacterium sp.]